MKKIKFYKFLTACSLAGLLTLPLGCTRRTGRSETEVKPTQEDEKPDTQTGATGEARPDWDQETPSVEEKGENPMVLMKTSMGDIKIELFKNKAPISVKNFLRYVEEGHYNGTIFHRVISNFMIQGGGFTPDLQQKSTHAPIKNEADNGLKNTRGTIAMARTQVVDSATAQFFINVQDNPNLDHRGPGPGFGYAVFGRVTEGMDVVDKIRNVKTGSKGPLPRDVPLETVLIKEVEVLASEAATEEEEGEGEGEGEGDED